MLLLPAGVLGFLSSSEVIRSCDRLQYALQDSRQCLVDMVNIDNAWPLDYCLKARQCMQVNAWLLLPFTACCKQELFEDSTIFHTT